VVGQCQRVIVVEGLPMRLSLRRHAIVAAPSIFLLSSRHPCFDGRRPAAVLASGEAVPNCL
jgi:hypothetical protein